MSIRPSVTVTLKSFAWCAHARLCLSLCERMYAFPWSCRFFLLFLCNVRPFLYHTTRGQTPRCHPAASSTWYDGSRRYTPVHPRTSSAIGEHGLCLKDHTITHLACRLIAAPPPCPLPFLVHPFVWLRRPTPGGSVRAVGGIRKSHTETMPIIGMVQACAHCRGSHRRSAIQALNAGIGSGCTALTTPRSQTQDPVTHQRWLGIWQG